MRALDHSTGLAMPKLLLGAIAALILWIVLVFVFPLGPGAASVHLLLGLAGALFVRWYALTR